MPLSDAEFEELRSQGREVMQQALHDDPDTDDGWASSAAFDTYPDDPARAEALHEGMLDAIKEHEGKGARR